MELARWKEEGKACLGATFLAGLAAHAYFYFKGSFSHDSLYTIVTAHDDAWQISLGRYLQPFLRSLRNGLSAPWLIGMLSLLFVALSALLMVRTLDIRSRGRQVLTCAVLTVNLTFTLLTASYVTWADLFMLSLLLAVGAVFLLKRFKWGFLAGILCVGASMGIYQSYVAVTASLVAMAAIGMLLEGRRWREVLAFGCKGVVMVGLGALLYLAGLQGALSLTGVELSQGYNSVSTALHISGETVPQLLGNTYREFFAFFFTPDGYTSPALLGFNGLVMAAILLLAGAVAWRRRLSGPAAGLLIFSMASLPFLLNMTVFFSQGMLHHLMIFPLNLVYVLCLLLWELWDRDGAPVPARAALAGALGLGFLLFTWNGILYANNVYLKKDLEDRQTLSVMTRVADRIEQTEGYVPGETTVILVGNLPGVPMAGFEDYDDVGLTGHLSVTYWGGAIEYIRYELGLPVETMDGVEYWRLTKREEVQTIPAFPARDCCRWVDGILVVRLG